MLDCLLDLAGPQAPGANTHSLYRAVFQNSHALEVRIKLPGANIVGMGDGMTKNGAFRANMALHWHKFTPVKAVNSINRRTRSQYRNTEKRGSTPTKLTDSACKLDEELRRLFSAPIRARQSALRNLVDPLDIFDAANRFQSLNDFLKVLYIGDVHRDFHSAFPGRQISE